MTNEETKRWLNRGYKLNEEINQLEAAKHTMFDRLTSITPAYDGETVSGTKDPHKYDAYFAYCADIDNRVNELFDIKREIQQIIAKVDDAKLRALLLGRYINFMTFEQIAVNMSYDWRWIMRLHNQALNAVNEVLNKPY